MNKTVLDFYADWCGPCKHMKPYFVELEKRFPSIKFETVNVDENEGLTFKYKIMAMPTFVFLVNGQEVDRLQGADPEDLIRKVEKLNRLKTPKS